MAPKRSLLEASFKQDAAAKRPRRAGAATVAQQVAKALLDNFKGFTEQEIETEAVTGQLAKVIEFAPGVEVTASHRIFDEREAVLGGEGLRHPRKPAAESIAFSIPVCASYSSSSRLTST